MTPEELKLMREKIQTDALEAQRLIQHPMLAGFFKTEKDACILAFERLPLGATLENYQTVHHRFLASRALSDTLNGYINKLRRIEELEKATEEEGEDAEE